MAFATLDELMARIGHGSATGTDSLAAFEATLDSATETIQDDIGRVVVQSTGARKFGVDGYTDLLHLPDFRSIVTLKLDDDDDGTHEVTVSASGYEIDKLIDKPAFPYDMVRLLDRHFPVMGRRRLVVEVDAMWGWSAVPTPLRDACILLAARVAQRPKQALFGTQSFGELGAAMIRAKDPDYWHLIGPYIRPQVA